MKNYTDITVLVDRSGSMGSIKGAMEEAFQTFLIEHKQVPSTRITLVQFDTSNDHEVVYQNVPIVSAENLNIQPRGGTPLNDAMCKVIDSTGTRLREMNESDRPNKVLLVTITDGQENSSNTFNRANVKSRVLKQQNEFNWQFIYLGANQDTYAESQSLGIPWSNTLKFSMDAQSIRSLGQTLALNSTNYTKGASASAGNYTVSERTRSASKADRSKDSNPDKEHK